MANIEALNIAAEKEKEKGKIIGFNPRRRDDKGTD